MKPLTRDLGSVAPAWWIGSSWTGPGQEAVSAPGHSGAPDGFVRQRISALLEVSSRFAAGISLAELCELLPPDGPADGAALGRWLSARPDVADLDGVRAFAPGSARHDLEGRQRRARAYRVAAERLVQRDLRILTPWIRCAALTGSAAYGAPEVGDDIDLFVVVRTGSMWLFLIAATLGVRLRYRPCDEEGRPRPCLNYVLDERSAAGEFAPRRGFLFAREALTAQILRGDDYYRTLLASAPWMGGEIPRMYALRSAGPLAPPAKQLAWPIRFLNAAVYPPLAFYLHLVGMYRMARLRRDGGPVKEFRTVVRFRRLAVPNDLFDRLALALERASASEPVSTRRASPSRAVTAR
jgi:hypothetical protein